MQKILNPTSVVLLASVAFVLARLAVQHTWTAFVDYDGYFSYYIAHWGFDADKLVPLMDSQGASYRYQRIIYPLLAYLMSLGGNVPPALISLVALNIVSITGGTYFVARILDGMGTNPWYSLVFGLYGSQFLGLMTSLSEPMTFFFVVMAIYCWSRERMTASIWLFAIAALTKEAALLFLGAFIAHYLLEHKWALAGRMGLAILPYGLWQVGLLLWLGKPGFASGPSFQFPLWGWISGFAENPQLSTMLAIILIPMSYLPMLGLGIKTLIGFVSKKDWHPYSLMILIHVAFMLVLPGPTAREPAAMVRITQGLVLATLLYGSLIQSKRILNYSVLWIGTLALLVNGSGQTAVLPR